MWDCDIIHKIHTALSDVKSHIKTARAVKKTLYRNNSANVLYRHTVNNFLPAKKHPSLGVGIKGAPSRAHESKGCILLQFQLVSGRSTGTRYSIFHLLDPGSGGLRRFSLVKNRYVLFLEVEEGGNIGDNGRRERCNFEMSIPVTRALSLSLSSSLSRSAFPLRILSEFSRTEQLFAISVQCRYNSLTTCRISTWQYNF